VINYWRIRCNGRYGNFKREGGKYHPLLEQKQVKPEALAPCFTGGPFPFAGRGAVCPSPCFWLTRENIFILEKIFQTPYTPSNKASQEKSIENNDTTEY
jgi:hypothetical protein